MRGTLRPKKDRPGYWELRVDAGSDPITKRRRQISRGFRGTRKDAEKALRALASEVDAGRHRGTKGTVAKLLEQWYDNRVDGWSVTHAARVRSVIDYHLVPALGATPLSKLEASDLDAFYRRLLRQEGLSPASVRKIHNTLRSALGQAVKYRWLSMNPATEVDLPPLHGAELRPPTPAEVARLVAHVDATNPDFGTFIRLASVTGARRGELCGLQARDFDPEENTLYIGRSVAQVGSQTYVKDTKTHQARRIALAAGAVELVTSHLERMAARAAAAGEALAPDHFLFSDALDCSVPWKPASVTHRWGRLRRDVGLPGVRLHDVRHLVATQLLGDGVPVRTVSGRLGHRRASVTLDIYAAWIPASDRDAAERMERILAGNDKKPAPEGTGGDTVGP